MAPSLSDDWNCQHKILCHFFDLHRWLVEEYFEAAVSKKSCHEFYNGKLDKVYSRSHFIVTGIEKWIHFNKLNKKHSWTPVVML